MDVSFHVLNGSINHFHDCLDQNLSPLIHFSHILCKHAELEWGIDGERSGDIR